MKISIVTVCFNAKYTIEDTFLSIFNQTYKDIELIVIDGASTDGTLGIVEKYKDKISHFVSESDEGIYDAMNKGIKASTGDFIIFLNANDSFYDNEVLEKVARVLNENSDVKFLFGDVNYISEDKKTAQILTYEKITNDFAILTNNICHQSIFYHRSLFENFGFYSKDYKIYADWDFNIKCLVQNKVRSVYSPIIISKFQLGGACSNSNAMSFCKIDKKLLIDRYYNKYKFLIQTDSFFKVVFKPLFCPLKRLLINPIVGLYASQQKYLLNVKKVEIKN